MAKKKNPCTNWFPGNVKPFHEGVYKRLWKSYDGKLKIVYTAWDGNFWGLSFDSIDFPAAMAWEMRDARGKYQKLAWLGLANNPNEVEK